MSVAEALPMSEDSVKYQYNKVGNVRAPIHSTFEAMLDIKLVQQPYATPDFLVTLGGQAAEARSAGFELSFQTANAMGVETLNEMTGQWRPIVSSATFVVVASFPS